MYFSSLLYFRLSVIGAMGDVCRCFSIPIKNFLFNLLTSVIWSKLPSTSMTTSYLRAILKGVYSSEGALLVVVNPIAPLTTWDRRAWLVCFHLLYKVLGFILYPHFRACGGGSPHIFPSPIKIKGGASQDCAPFFQRFQSSRMNCIYA